MQNGQYSQGAASAHQSSQFLPSEPSPTGGSTTSSLRQFRKKDVDKSSNVEQPKHMPESHVARVAPHNHYPPSASNDVYRFPHNQFAGFSPQMKYSDIADATQPTNPISTSVITKPKPKEYMDMCNVPQQQQILSNHQQQYSPDNGQYMHKDSSQSFPSGFKSESHFFPKDKSHYQQLAHHVSGPGFNPMMPQNMRKYNATPQDNPFLNKLSKIHPTMARSIMSDHHLQDNQPAMAYSHQNHRYFSGSMHQPNPYTLNSNYPMNGPHSYGNYPGGSCSYPRSSQMGSMPSRGYGMDRSMSPGRRGYGDPMHVHMNYANFGSGKMSQPHNYPGQYNRTPEYAQHYQHRRLPQDCYPQSCRPQYLSNHHHQMTGPEMQELAENTVSPSDSLKKFIENWADEDQSAEINSMEANMSLREKLREDAPPGTVFMINANDVQYFENNGIPIVTSDNGGLQLTSENLYLLKNGLVDNGGMLRLVEANKEPPEAGPNQDRIVNLQIMESSPKSDCMLSNKHFRPDDSHGEDDRRVVVHQNTILSPQGDIQVPLHQSVVDNLSSTKELVDKNCSPINMDHLDSGLGFSEPGHLETDKNISKPTIDRELTSPNLSDPDLSQNSDDSQFKSKSMPIIDFFDEAQINPDIDTPKDDEDKCSENSEHADELDLPKGKRKRIFSVDDIMHNIGNNAKKDKISKYQVIKDFVERESEFSSLEQQSSHFKRDNIIRAKGSTVLLQLAGQLMRISVNLVNDRNTITVTPISNPATLVDYNDNYQVLDDECAKIDDSLEETLPTEEEETHNPSSDTTSYDVIEATTECSESSSDVLAEEKSNFNSPILEKSLNDADTESHETKDTIQSNAEKEDEAQPITAMIAETSDQHITEENSDLKENEDNDDSVMSDPMKDSLDAPSNEEAEDSVTKPSETDIQVEASANHPSETDLNSPVLPETNIDSSKSPTAPVETESDVEETTNDESPHEHPPDENETTKAIVAQEVSVEDKETTKSPIPDVLEEVAEIEVPNLDLPSEDKIEDEPQTPSEVVLIVPSETAEEAMDNSSQEIGNTSSDLMDEEVLNDEEVVVLHYESEIKEVESEEVVEVVIPCAEPILELILPDVVCGETIIGSAELDGDDEIECEFPLEDEVFITEDPCHEVIVSDPLEGVEGIEETRDSPVILLEPVTTTESVEILSPTSTNLDEPSDKSKHAEVNEFTSTTIATKAAKKLYETDLQVQHDTVSSSKKEVSVPKSRKPILKKSSRLNENEARREKTRIFRRLKEQRKEKKRRLSSRESKESDDKVKRADPTPANEEEEEFVDFKELVRARNLKRQKRRQEALAKLNSNKSTNVHTVSSSLAKVQEKATKSDICSVMKKGTDRDNPQPKVPVVNAKPQSKRMSLSDECPTSTSTSTSDPIYTNVYGMHPKDPRRRSKSLSYGVMPPSVSELMEENVKSISKKRISLEDYVSRKRKASRDKADEKEKRLKVESTSAPSTRVNEVKTSFVIHTSDWEDSPSNSPSRIQQKNEFENFSKLKPVVDFNEFNISDNRDRTLEEYKEKIDSQLSSLNLQIPKKPVKSRKLNIGGRSLSPETDTLIRRFMENEKLSPTEMDEIRKIICYKRSILQNQKNVQAPSKSPGTSSYEIRNVKDVKLHLKKIPLKRRISKESSEEDSGSVTKNDNLGGYCVLDCQREDGLKIILKRNTDFAKTGPVVELVKMDLEKLKEKYQVSIRCDIYS